MVAIQGASGASPDGLPRAREDEEMNPEGVLPSGHTVSFTAVEKMNLLQKFSRLRFLSSNQMV